MLHDFLKWCHIRTSVKVGLPVILLPLLNRGSKTRLSIKGCLERLSTLGLICRLAADSPIATECRQLLAEQSAYLRNAEKMTAVPVEKPCQLQIQAGLATMIALTKSRMITWCPAECFLFAVNLSRNRDKCESAIFKT